MSTADQVRENLSNYVLAYIIDRLTELPSDVYQRFTLLSENIEPANIVNWNFDFAEPTIDDLTAFTPEQAAAAWDESVQYLSPP